MYCESGEPHARGSIIRLPDRVRRGPALCPRRPAHTAKPFRVVPRAGVVVAMGRRERGRTPESHTDCVTVSATTRMARRKRRSKPQPREIGAGKQYADRAAFEADVERWHQEQAEWRRKRDANCHAHSRWRAAVRYDRQPHGASRHVGARSRSVLLRKLWSPFWEHVSVPKIMKYPCDGECHAALCAHCFARLVTPRCVAALCG